MTQLIIDDADLRQMLGNITGRLQNPRGILMAIGETLVESTKGRFATSTAPDGSRWAPNSPVTLARFLHSKSSHFDKKGRVSGKGRAALSGKQPLIGHSKNLSTGIHYVLVDGHSVAVGSNAIYSGPQQFGAAQGEFGRSARGPIPWGNIPARPFLGVSSADEAAIIDIVRNQILAKTGGGV